MPKMQFSTANKTSSGPTHPTLDIPTGGKARILCIEPEPTLEYAHTNKRVRIGDDGKPVTEWVKAKSGQQVEKDQMDFVGRHICLGDFGILTEKGSDPAHCPSCELANKGELGVGAPERRFAMHVMKYATKPGSTELQTPFQVECVVWAFTDKVFNTLADLSNEWGSLQEHDLFIMCVNAMYKNYEISIAPDAKWLKSEEWKQLTAEVYKGNQAADLSAFCGRTTTRAYLATDLESIKAANRQAYGRKEEERTFGVGAPKADLDDMLSTQAGEIIAEPVDLGTAITTLIENAPSEEAAPKPTSGKVDFMNLLADLQ